MNLFDEVLHGIPKIGDYVLVKESLCVGFIVGRLFKSEYMSQYDLGELKGEDEPIENYWKVHEVRTSFYGKYNHSAYNYRIDDFIIITKKLYDLFVSLGDNYIDLIRKIAYLRSENPTDMNVVEDSFNTVVNYLNGDITPHIKSVLTQIGVKKVIERDKKTGHRLVEYNNGQIWVVRRKKYKKTERRINIRNYNINRKESVKKSSVSYTLIKRIK